MLFLCVEGGGLWSAPGSFDLSKFSGRLRLLSSAEFYKQGFMVNSDPPMVGNNIRKVPGILLACEC